MLIIKKITRKLLHSIFPFLRRIGDLERFLWGAVLCEIKTGVTIQRNCRVDALTDVGEYTYIGFNNFITRTSIGRYCSIANFCSIGMGEHNLSSISTSSYLDASDDIFEEQTKLPLVIGHDVWIGQDCVLRRGITIGTGAVIGANSFVNTSIPDFAVVAGNPARIIRYRFPEEKRKRILESCWWEHPPLEARRIIKQLEGA